MTTLQTQRAEALSQISSLESRYSGVRSTSTAICDPLEIEDYVVQSMPDTSPAKWHLAHTSWFFERFILRPHLAAYRGFDDRFDFLFNSYYQTIGPMHQRPRRGLLTRPTVAEVIAYRNHIDEHMLALLNERADDEQIRSLTTLGLHHEQQHQELMLTDIKHLFSCNPLLPAYRPASISAHQAGAASTRFVSFEGGIQEIGRAPSDTAEDFCFDNETPTHRVLLEPYALADRLVTNREYLEFVRDGGYRRADLWLSDGWSTVNAESWSRPFYWNESLDAEFTLAGTQPLHPAAPVCHLSYYEADAFARWADARLPLESEWEFAAQSLRLQGNLLPRDGIGQLPLHPQPAGDATGLKQMFGDVWEWTASPYTAYPRYRSPPGALGEYNGKFMCNQLVLRGGSCVTPADHIRATYRNFFYPQARWQFMGMRLARAL
ncbi:MAG TPA: ergothioneine biosynthesis protein EgtB [Steroidobacteraceae bacterium]|jgi:ergothioneine biosynthesis protein EgtB